MQHETLKHSALRFLFFLFGVTLLFSFTSPTGGDRFEIYLNKKLVFQQYVSLGTNTVKSFQVDRTDQNGVIAIVYSHCGQPGKNRVIKMTDANNRLVRQWSFGDAKNDKEAMTCLVKDILAAQKDKSAEKLNIYYSAEQLPNGRMLASVMLTDHMTTP